MMSNQRIFISADHGLAIVYFLQSELMSELLEHGAQVTLLTDGSLQPVLRERFPHPNLAVEDLRLEAARTYAQATRPELQWWLAFFRRVGSSGRINTEAQDVYLRQVGIEEGIRRRIWVPAARLSVQLLRRSRPLRSLIRRAQNAFNPRLYSDLFEAHDPALVIGSTPGWRLDRYLLREAKSRGVQTASVIVGWDNPSSYALPGAPTDWIACWSEVQRRELELGSDWPSDRVSVTGMPTYDGYFNRSWTMPKPEYFARHQLDPNRKLISYACSFVSYAPNLPNVRALAELVAGGRLAEPCQLLVRLHPNHFQDVHLYADERQQIHRIAEQQPHVHVVEPEPLGGSFGHYSGEDMPEKASMLAHSDVFVTVYSTMIVEAAIHEVPVISLCIDVPGGWNWPRKYSLALEDIGEWPTHQRFRQAGFGRVATNADELEAAVAAYLADPQQDLQAQRAFIQRECTYTDGSAGRRTAAAILDWLDGAG